MSVLERCPSQNPGVLQWRDGKKRLASFLLPFQHRPRILNFIFPGTTCLIPSPLPRFCSLCFDHQRRLLEGESRTQVCVLHRCPPLTVFILESCLSNKDVHVREMSVLESLSYVCLRVGTHGRLRRGNV